MQRKKIEAPLTATPFGERWLEWIDAFPVGGERQSKGRGYAERGAVLGMESNHGVVDAFVEGSQSKPYRVTVEFTPVEREKWEELWRAAAPEDLKNFRRGMLTVGMERSFDDAGIKLLPERYKDVKSNCDCPDWMRPCKHTLAVLRVLGLEIGKNPLVLAKLRGDAAEAIDATGPPPVEEGEDLRADTAAYWGGNAEWGPLQARMLSAGGMQRLLKRLGPVAVYGVRMDPDAMFKPVYDGVAAEAKGMMDQVKGKLEK